MREPVTGVEVALELASLQALQMCSSFRSVEDHARRISSALGGQYTEEQVTGLLNRFSGAGLLWSASGMARELVREPDQRGGSGEDALEDAAIRTCGRPDSLERLLRSAALRDREHGVRRRYWVVDDSRDPEQQEATRTVVGRAKEEMDVVYWGVSEQRALMESLARRVPDHADTIHWLLSPDQTHEDVPGGTPGRGLNHVVLLSAGRRVALLDDDAVLEPQLAGAPETGVRITGQPPAARSLAVSQPRGAELSPSPVPLDAVSAHGQMLGKPLAVLLREQTRGRNALTREAVADLTTDDVAGLQPDSRVVLSTNAVVGDPGSADPSWAYMLGDEGLYQQMAASPEALETVTTQRDFWRGDRRLTIPTSRSLMFTTCTGLDNREMLPPVAPARRNEDRLFGAMVQYLFPDALTAAFPWALPHRPQPAREWDRASLDRFSRVGVNGLLASLADQTRGMVPGTTGVSARIGVLAERLRGLAEADRYSLRDWLAQEQLRKRANVVRVLNEELTAHPDAPEHWVQDVQRLIKANSGPVGDPAFLAGTVLGVSEPSPEYDEQALRELVGHYAVALTIWPELREHAVGAVAECLSSASG
ncbi:hypothetical protein [Thioalkalivibrio sp. ALE11]|uniref:hypothetical protein n=1 Tax=Thioalkalivibrio sp. ALE11 TaxID=1265494 RepID=UPI0012DC132F|nr:hypothetical protein [Thioalkalivibrio sp. ALE11]